ncbi:VirB4 family type IV secretion system protein, partial [Segeticoccus rhizosphaerae]|uniref:VirB4 family type IV secretion system protein n=1 Tax=Segeticoccus rhizosphaerae TaxID=1104777 RepID=UPI001EF0ED99
RAEQHARARARRDAVKAERHDAAYLPAGGQTGPDALRSYRTFRVPAHRATSQVLAGAYPFLAEAGLGSQGVFIGPDAWSGSGFCFDPWVLYAQGVLTNPNCLLAGVVGRGKSMLAKTMATRAIAFGRKVYVPGDPKGEWSIVTQAVGGAVIQLGGGSPNRLNPLDEGPRPAGMPDAAWAALVTTRRRTLLGSLVESALGRPMGATEHTALDQALRAAVTGVAPSTLPAVVDALFHPSLTDAGSSLAELAADGRQIGHALRRLVSGDLAGLFDGESTVAFDPCLPMISLDLSAITGSDQLIAMVMTCASAWMEAALTDPDGGQRWVVYDEAWRLLRQPALLARMQSQWKLSRGLGIANLMVIHRLTDLDAVGNADSEARALALGLLADCSTKIIYQQETSEAPHTADVLGLSATEQAELPNLQQGEGLWRVGNRAFVVRHAVTNAELATFNTNMRML